MTTRELTIVNKLGMHARAAAKFVNLASSFAAQVELEKDGRKVNGKSIMGVMMLAASQGSQVTLYADGEDEGQAARELETLVSEKFGESS